jgi:hypothetical protein
MDKKSYWFSHDYNAGQDPKMIKLQMSMGHEGKGIFWDLVELIYSEGGKLSMAECEGYAFALRTDKNKLVRIINDFDLFKNDGINFWSESINRRLELRNEKSIKAKQSAIKRWGDANAMRTHNDGNAIKEKKGKEMKGNKINTDVFIFSEKEKNEFSRFQNWIDAHTPSLSEMKEPFTIEQYFELRKSYRSRQITDMCEKMHNNPNITSKYKSAYLTLKNWIKEYGT